MEQMRISSYFSDFTLYEVIISTIIVRRKSVLITLSLLPLLDRSEFVKILDQLKENLQKLNWLVLTKPKSIQISSDSVFLMLRGKNERRFQIVSQGKMSEEISNSAYHWTSFSAFRFASG